MRITFLAQSVKRPIGGVTALYEFANGLQRRGHEVCMVHVDFIGTWSDRKVVVDTPIDRVEDVTWCRFEDGIDHRLGLRCEAELPPADVINYYSPTLPRHAGQPFLFLQGHRILPRLLEERLLTAPCPKICVASWLVGVAEGMGAPPAQLVTVPYGLDHDKYRIVVPPDQRDLQVAMSYSSHPTKGGKPGLEALQQVKARFPRLRAVIFSREAPTVTVPRWMTFHRSPPQRVIVEEIYNRSRVFLNPSPVEGFGLPSIEAMACGCALVTVANGGSDDYAIDGVTANVSKACTPTELAASLAELVSDDAERLRLSAAGTRFVQRFDWDQSARQLEAFLAEYAANPAASANPAAYL